MSSSMKVAPFAGAWIEIEGCCASSIWSPVAPFAGAWIEMSKGEGKRVYDYVAPFAGAWIEIHCVRGSTGALSSLPSRERGLKSDWLGLVVLLD